MERGRHLVADSQGLAACIDAVAAESRVGLDTESNGFHAYFEKICLLQLATATADWVVDPLAVDPKPLLELLRDPAREVILHAAEFDVLCLKRDHGITLGRIFDTHAAAKVLGIQKVGLHNLLAEQLGVHLTIDEQRSDWGRRPLSPTQIEYAFADVQYLLALRDLLGAQLAAAGREPEARAEFARLAAKEPRPRGFDAEGWQRMTAARTLDGPGRGVLRELYLLRDRRAREVDRPAFKVLSELFLAEAARRKPATEEELSRVPGAAPAALKRIGPQLLEAVQRGLSGAPPPRGRPGGRGRKGQGPPAPEVEERYERLRAWRRGHAESRKVEVQVIAPNAVLLSLAKRDPETLEQLAGVEGMDSFRVEQYGQELLAVLAEARTAAKAAPAGGAPG